MSFLELSRLVKTYPDGTRAVLGVDLAVERGELVVLLGPSGCGKTTTLRMVAGLETPSAGCIVLDGEDVTARPPARRDVGFVFQFYALYPHLTVAENIAFPLVCAGVPRAERAAAVRRVAERLGLAPLLARRPRELSGGDQQRVGLARALVRQPRAWLMDEPLGTLDADRRAEMAEFLRARQLEDGVTTLYVTHDQEEALRLADRVVVMAGGRILQVGAPQAIYDEPATLFVARFVGSPGMNLIEGQVAQRAGASVFRARGGVEIALARAVRPGAAVLGVRPEGWRPEPGGAWRGRVAADEFAGSSRCVHVEGEFGRVAVRVRAEAARALGEEVALALDPRDARLFDPAGGGRLA